MNAIAPISLLVARKAAGGSSDALALLALGLLAVFAAVVFSRARSAAENEANRTPGFGS